MTVTITPYVEDVNAEIAAGYTQLKLYRDTAPDGLFATLIDTATLEADVLEYPIEDDSGAATHWYRYAFYNPSTLTLTALSDPSRPDVVRLLDVVFTAAEMAGAAFAGTCSATGTVSKLVDSRLRDEGVGDDFLKAAYLYRPNADAGDRMRRLTSAPFSESDGGLQPLREWAVAPAEDEPYYVFLLLPPFSSAGGFYSWARAAREGLQACEFEDTVDIGTGTAARTSRFDLGTFLGFLREGDVRAVKRRRYDADGLVIANRDASKEGGFWETEPNGRGQLTLIVRPAPSTEEHILVVANRRDAEIYTPDDITGCPLRLAALATLWKAYGYLDRIHGGKYAGEHASAYAEWFAEYTGEMPSNQVKPS